VAKRKTAQCSLQDHPTTFLMAGYELKQTAAAKLEERLKNTPSDLPCHLKLLGYYFKHSHSSKSAARKQLQSVSWMIEQMPEHETLGDPWAAIDKESNPSGYNKCKKLWLRQLAKSKDNVAVVSNAASFLRFDSRIAERLYRRAVILEPRNPDRSRDLAWFLRRLGRKNSPKMKDALAAIQDAVRKTKEPIRKYYLYDDLAEIAFDAGKWSIARSAAKKCVSLAGKFGKNWNDGNAIHDGNCTLGRLALRNGRLSKAIFHLNEAGKTGGSPQLDSFGPNMRFAQEMLRAGLREPVIEYLEACKRFWDGKSQNLSDCISQIERGKSPRLPRVI
jgi:tetratricopeptide (TPR) repeat protein